MGFRVPGKVAKRLVEVGQTVDVGQPLATLDEVDLKLQAEQAEAEFRAATGVLAQAAAAEQRAKDLRAKGWTTDAQMDQSRAAADEARARLNRAERSVELTKNSLSYATLVADTRGVVTATLIDPGQVVASGQTAIRVARFAEKEAVVAIPETLVGRAKSGTASVTLWSDADKKYAAKLREIAPSADPATRTYLAKFSLPEADDNVSLGMTATLTLADAATERVAKLPLSALFSQGSNPSLYIVDDAGAVTLKPVVVKSYESNSVVISGGVDRRRQGGRARRAEARSGPEGPGGLVAVVLSFAVIASAAKQSISPPGSMDCFVASLLAMTAIVQAISMLESDMKRFNLSGWAVSHPTLILFLMIALGAAGFFSYQRLGRAEDPFFTVKVVNVSAIWPGATAQEMQTQVADPIEKKLQELPFFEKVQTYSKPSFTAMQVTFKDSTPPKDVPYLFYLLRKKLADVQGELPAGLLGPTVNDEFSDVDSILYMMTGDGADYAQLKKAAEGMRQRLLKVPGVTKVDLYGTQDERIFVEFSHAKLATLGITPQALFDSLAKQNNVTPAGTVETSSQRVPLRVTGALDGAKAVAETPVESNGRVFRLGDIATVTHGFVDPPTFVVRQEGKPAIGIGVVTAKGANILELGKDVENATNDFMKAVPQGIDVEQIADQPKVVEHAVGEFVHSFIEALGDRAVRLLPRARLAHRHRGRDVGAAGAGDRLHRHERDVDRPAPHHARRADHRARPAGRRRHHRGRDDGGEDGAGLGPRPRGVLCLGINCVSDADGHAGHGRWLPADRLCQLGGRRICRRHLLDRGDRAGRLLVRRGDLHALYRRQAAAEHHASTTTTIRTRSTRRGSTASCARWCSGASTTGSRWCWRPSACSCSRSSASATCSSSSSRSPSGPSCSCSCACRKAPPSTSRKSP